MFAEEDELVVVAGPSSPDEYVVRHMVGGRSDMLWLDSRNAFTSDHTMAKVMTEVEARIAAEGQRVTFKEQHNYVFDVVAKDQVDMLLKAASLAIVKERDAREAAKTTGGAAPGGGAVDPYERYEKLVADGVYVVDADGYYLDDDGDRVDDNNFEGGEARRGHHKMDPNSPGNRPKDPNRFDVKAKLDAFRQEVTKVWAGQYGTIAAALGCQHSDPGDGWHTSSVWWIEFHDGETVCVSDWDQSSTYDDDLPEPEDIRGGVSVKWRIEGSRGGVDRVVAALGL